jgi:hypothetical protein
MAKSPKPTEQEVVATYMQTLDHPLKEVVVKLTRVILGADKEIAEQIKWNSPSFYYTGTMKPFDPKEYKRDIVVLNLHRKDSVLLVFPTGSKLNDTTGILEGNYTDGRRLAKITGLDDAEMKQNALQHIIKEWIGLVDK